MMTPAARAYYIQRLGRRSRNAPRGTRAGVTSAATLVLEPGNFIHEIRSDNSGVARAVTVGTNGTFGQQKTIVMVAKPNGADSFALDAASFIKADGATAASITFSSANQFVTCEFNGSKWRIIASTAIIT